ncbi:hypothetical protein R6Z07M_009494 [Ovis aries]
MHAFKTPKPADAIRRKHLQEISDQSSNLTTNFTRGWGSSKTSEMLSGMGVSALEKEEVDSENIPQELRSNLSHPQSPPRKRLKSKVNDKDFVIVCRPKLNRENFPSVSWDFLPDELLLGIFSCLCLLELMKVSSVCKRWYKLVFDEFLWQTVDLAGRNLYPDVVGWLLSQGVVAFHCHLCLPQSFMDQPLAEHFSPFRLQHPDLSNSVINVISALEGLQLSDPVVNNLAQNTNLLRRNLSGYSGFSESSLKTLLSSCSRLDELNLSWCYDFTEKHVQVAVAHVSETITQLNLSRYCRNLQRSDVSTLYLQHLSFIWCYDIIPETLLELGEIPTLETFQVFGIMPDGTLYLLKEALPHLQINCSHFITIARPTIGNKKNQEIRGIKCCHWQSPVIYEASVARWCLLFSLNRESRQEA